MWKQGICRCKAVKVRSPWIAVGCNATAHVPVIGEDTHRHMLSRVQARERRGQELAVMHPQAEDTWSHLQLEEKWNRCFLRASKGNQPSDTLKWVFWPPELWRIDFCCSKPRRWWGLLQGGRNPGQTPPLLTQEGVEAHLSTPAGRRPLISPGNWRR